MTTLTLIAGMLPLALGTGPGAEERRAVAVVVIGGQALCLLADPDRDAGGLFAARRSRRRSCNGGTGESVPNKSRSPSSKKRRKGNRSAAIYCRSKESTGEN